jgi:predicted PurR-regulated permease PerM
MLKNWSRWLTIGVIVIILAVVLSYFSNIVTYLLIAWVLSMIGQPIMQFLLKIRYKRIGMPSSLAALLTIICFYFFFGLLLYIFVPPIVEQAQNLTNVDYNSIEKNLEKPMAQANQWLHRYGILPPNRTAVDQLFFKVKNLINPTMLSSVVETTVSAFGGILIGVSSVSFILFFFLKDQSMFGDFLSGVVPQHYELHVITALDNIRDLLIRYFGGIVLQMVGVMIIVSGGLTILGVKNAMLIGFFAALMNIIPYVGPVIGAVFAALITFSSNLDLDFYTQLLPLILKVLLVFPIMHLIDGFILQPYIFSNSVMAHPLEIFIVILIGADIAGVGGMVLAIPAYTVLRVIAKVFFNEFRFVQMITDNLESDIEAENLKREVEL